MPDSVTGAAAAPLGSEGAWSVTSCDSSATAARRPASDSVEWLAGILARVRDDMGQIRSLAAAHDLVADEVALAAVKYTVITAVEGCVQAAVHVADSERLGASGSPTDAVRLLGDEGAVPEAVTEAVIRAVAFHDELLDPARVVSADVVLGNLALLEDLEAFTAAIAGWAAEAATLPMIPQGSLDAVALRVARCGEVDRARTSSGHPCSTIVGLQPAAPSQWQVPEGWAGALATARILFVSSNPSISEAGDAQSGSIAELYPRGDWSDTRIADFVTHRFDSPRGWATPEGYFRREDDSWSPKAVQFWVRVRKRAAELVGDTASPVSDYAMTEVVHCKSKGEKGVAAAASLCAQRHLDRIIEACPAPLIVVLGAKARSQATELWSLPDGFGLGGGTGLHGGDDLVTRRLGGRERVVAYLTHPTGMTSPQTFAATYPERLEDLRGLVAGSLPVESFTQP